MKDIKENIKQSPATILQDFRCKQVSSSNPMFVHLDNCMVRIDIYEFKCEENKDRAVLFVQEARGLLLIIIEQVSCKALRLRIK